MSKAVEKSNVNNLYYSHRFGKTFRVNKWWIFLLKFSNSSVCPKSAHLSLCLCLKKRCQKNINNTKKGGYSFFWGEKTFSLYSRHASSFYLALLAVSWWGHCMTLDSSECTSHPSAFQQLVHNINKTNLIV